MHNELKKIYNNLLDCHIANLYSFYFKLYKYEKYFQKKTNLDISVAVDNVIDIVNDAIGKGEISYHYVGHMPELSMRFLTDRSVISHQFSPSSQYVEILNALSEDQEMIEKTLELTIQYSDSLRLQDDAIRLMESHKTIHQAFEGLKVVLQ
ncbi:MAG: hypothetical protein JXO44_03650 [Clostridia bacterium]|nr:hypothetical protein [Clostridia bacterium]